MKIEKEKELAVDTSHHSLLRYMHAVVEYHYSLTHLVQAHKYINIIA